MKDFLKGFNCSFDASGYSIPGIMEVIKNGRFKAMKEDNAKNQARAQYQSIKQMVKKLQSKKEEVSEQGRQEISEDALDVGIIKQYFILLCTGGPAVRIIGNLDEFNEPITAKLQYQDWFTPWTDYKNNGTMEEDLLTYAREFYFEGIK